MCLQLVRLVLHMCFRFSACENRSVKEASIAVLVAGMSAAKTVY